MRTLISTIALTGLIAASSTASKASGIPVVDLSNLTQAVIDYGQQYNQITNQIQQIQQMADQYKQQLKDFDSMTGSYGMGDLLNSQIDKDLRDSIPGTWEDAYNAVYGSQLPSHQSDVSLAIQSTQAAGQAYSSEEIFVDENSVIKDRFEYNSGQTYAGLGVSTATFNNTPKRIKNVEQLIEQIELAHDPKAAMDLQIRMQAETSFLVNEMVRQQSLANMIMSRSQQRELNRRGIELKKVKNITFPEIK